MSKQDLKNAALKKVIGLRFKEFREAIKKSQDELANELKVCQGTIANIENGRFYPKFKMQHYLHGQYHLNLNWLLTGKGEMIISPGKDSKTADFPILFSHIDEDDPRYEGYMELKSLMSIPVIEQIILAKLEELKLIAREVSERWGQVCYFWLWFWWKRGWLRILFTLKNLSARNRILPSPVSITT